MANARTQGATARAASWDSYEEAGPQRTGSWLPLEALTGEELFEGAPHLQQAAATRRTVFAPSRQQPPQVTHTTSQRVLNAMPQTRTQQQQTQQMQQGQAGTLPVGRVQAKALAMAAGAMLGLLALYVAVSAVVDWTTVKMDDFQYGRPRTSQMDAYVGHGESEGAPSHFIAMNLNRRVTILELPGGDSAKASAIVGPYLFGQGEDLTPVQMSTQDVNGDGKADLVVSVKSEQLMYLNDGLAFRLATPEEQTAIQKAMQARSATQPSKDAQNAGAGK